jgi:hypothetical protein
VLKDIFGNKSNFQRFVLAVLLFLFHKLTGTDSLNVSPQLPSPSLVLTCCSTTPLKSSSSSESRATISLS